MKQTVFILVFTDSTSHALTVTGVPGQVSDLRDADDTTGQSLTGVSRLLALIVSPFSQVILFLVQDDGTTDDGLFLPRLHPDHHVHLRDGGVALAENGFVTQQVVGTSGVTRT